MRDPTGLAVPRLCGPPLHELPIARPCPGYGRAQVRDAGEVSRIDHRELHRVIEPVLARAVPMLRGDRHRVLLSREVAVHTEDDFDGIALRKSSEVDLFDAGVGAVNVDAEAVANQQAENGVLDRSGELGFNVN